MKKLKLSLITWVCLILAMPVYGQQSDINWVSQLQEMDRNQMVLLVIIGVTLVLILFLMLVMLYLLSFLRSVLRKNTSAEETAPSWWQRFNERFVSGKMKPIDEEKEIALDHSYDGIVELDNFMPPWLKWLFYATIAFGIVYFFNYSVFQIGKTQIQEYEEELRLAALQEEERKAFNLTGIDETNVQFDASGPSLKAGQTLYEGNCAACHAADGGGGVGPNLTDEYWLHGGSINDVFRIIKYGVVEKGMIPWNDQLSPEQMQQVASYILTMQGTTPANPKEPQGERYESAIEQPVDALGEDELGLESASLE
ncbi:cbb3-type cytochrome c oxidase N-terminal domain-containing protein [Negadavirga shengliensis]|uniref:Cbb3-type cytochrome c oxidase N-terminal domain-containing protein n=1 Tax=Negadavirga shengliensis TaxID=1389218 RepID=A0ABV9T568_9BACT